MVEAASTHVVEDQSAVVAFLTDSATHAGASVERIDTHAAMVFLAGNRAYKLKRAVRFPYMDFSTPARRRQLCEREVALNRRTAPDLYLGVSAIVRRPDGTLAFDETGEPCDWVVVMRRFDQASLFDRLAERGALTASLMQEMTDAVAAFHRDAERIGDHADSGGGAAGMAWVVEDNIAEFGERPDLFSAEATARLAAASREAVIRATPMLDRRRDAGWVRRCHGDLHLRNICLLDDRPTLFDAIEFNDRLSCIDVWYDLAFLLMDLEHRGLRTFANLVLNRYLQQTGDLSALPALPLFLSARAAVRAKVSGSAEPSQPSAAARQHLRTEARQYFAAAAAYLQPAEPCLVAIGGLSGSGKSTLGRRLAPAIGTAPGALHLRSDTLRKAMHGVGELERLPESAYAPAEHARVYAALAEQARTALAAGFSVIVDAVFAPPEERAAVEDLARGLGRPFVGLWLEAPAALLIARTADREAGASDATPVVVRRQLDYDLGRLTWRRLDAARTIEEIGMEANELVKSDPARNRRRSSRAD